MNTLIRALLFFGAIFVMIDGLAWWLCGLGVAIALLVGTALLIAALVIFLLASDTFGF